MIFNKVRLHIVCVCVFVGVCAGEGDSEDEWEECEDVEEVEGAEMMEDLEVSCCGDQAGC